MSRRVGRPRAAPGTKRSINVTVPMTPDEHAARTAAASEAGQPLSDWMRVVTERELAECAQEVSDDAAPREGEA